MPVTIDDLLKKARAQRTQAKEQQELPTPLVEPQEQETTGLSIDAMIAEARAKSPAKKKDELPQDFWGRTTNWEAAKADFALGATRLYKALGALGDLAAMGITMPLYTLALADAAGYAAFTAAGMGTQTVEGEYGEPVETPRPPKWDPEGTKERLEYISSKLIWEPRSDLGKELVNSVMKPVADAIQGFAKEIVSTPYPIPFTDKMVKLQDIVRGAQEATELGLQGALVFVTPAIKGIKASRLPKLEPISAKPPLEVQAEAAIRMEKARNTWDKIRNELKVVEEKAPGGLPPSGFPRTTPFQEKPTAPKAKAPEVAIPEKTPEVAMKEPEMALSAEALEAQQAAIRKQRQLDEENAFKYIAEDVQKKAAESSASLEAPPAPAPTTTPTGVPIEMPEQPGVFETKTSTGAVYSIAPEEMAKIREEAPLPTEPPATGWTKAPYGGYSSLTPEEIANVQKILEKGPIKTAEVVPPEAAPVPKPKKRAAKRGAKTVDDLITEARKPSKPMTRAKSINVGEVLSKILSDESGMVTKEFLEKLSDPVVRRAIEPYLHVYEALLGKLNNVSEATLKEMREKLSTNDTLAYFSPQHKEIKIAKQGEKYGGLLPKRVDAAEQLRELKHEFGGHFLELFMHQEDIHLLLDNAEKVGVRLNRKWIEEYWRADDKAYMKSQRAKRASEMVAEIFENTSPGEWAQIARPVLERIKNRMPKEQATKMFKALSDVEALWKDLRPAFRSRSTGKIMEHPEAKTHREILQWKDVAAEKLWDLPQELGLGSIPGLKLDGPIKEGERVLAYNFTDQATQGSFIIPPDKLGDRNFIMNELRRVRTEFEKGDKHEYILGVPDDLEYGWITKQGTFLKYVDEAAVRNNNEKIVSTLPNEVFETTKKIAKIIEKDKRPWPQIVQEDFKKQIKMRHVNEDGTIYVNGEKVAPTPEAVSTRVDRIMEDIDTRQKNIDKYQDLIDAGRNEDLQAIRIIDGNDSRLLTAEEGISQELITIDANMKYADSLDQVARAYWRKVLVDQKGELYLRRVKGEQAYKGHMFDFFRIMRGDQRVGELHLNYNDSKKELNVSYITTAKGEKLGFRELNQLRHIVMDNYPEAKVVTGLRISGMGKNSLEELRIPLKSRLGSEKGSIDSGIFRSIAEFFAPQLGIPNSAAYLAARYKTMGSINIIEASVKRTWEELRKYDEPTKKALFRYLDGQIPLDSLPPEVQYIARKLQIKNEMIGKALVKRGLLSPDAFEQHKGQYIRYLYLKHILGEDARPIATSGGRLDLTYLKQRKDLTYDQRKALGLIEDVSVAEPMTLSRSLSDMVKYDFFQKVLANEQWVWKPSVIKSGNRFMGIDALADEIKVYKDIVKKDPGNTMAKDTLKQMEDTLHAAVTNAEKAPADFYRVPDSKAYGPLRGAYINKKIADDIIPVFGGVAGQTPGAGIFNNLVRLEEKGMAAFKISKTALNVPTMFRNSMSNIIQLNMSGMNLGEIGYYMTKAGKSWAAKDINWHQARRYGLFKTNWAEGEIAEVLKVVQDFKPQSWYHMVDKLAPLAKFYGKIDDFFKLTKFMEQKAKGMSLEKAALEAQKWGMDYSLTSPTPKLLRRHIIPFGTYTYKITPLLAETMAKRPWVIAKYAALIPGSYALFQRMNDIDDKTWDRLYKQLPSFIKQSGSYAVLPMRNAEKQWQWVNLEYFFPWQAFHQVAGDILEKKFGELPQDVGIGNPYFTILASLAASKGGNPPIDMWTRQPIYNRVDPSKEKARKMVEWLYQQWAPPMLTRMGALGYTASIGDMTKQKHKITIEDAAGRWFGFNINPVTPGQRVSEIKGKKSLMIRELRKMFMDPSIDVDKKKAAIQEYKKQMKELLE